MTKGLRTMERSSRSQEMSLSAPSCLMKPFDMVFRAYFIFVSGSWTKVTCPQPPRPRGHTFWRRSSVAPVEFREILVSHAVLTLRLKPCEFFQSHHSLTPQPGAGQPTPLLKTACRRLLMVSPLKVRHFSPNSPASTLTCENSSPRSRERSPKWSARCSSAICL